MNNIKLCDTFEKNVYENSREKSAPLSMDQDVKILRETLGAEFELIRFPIMELKDFADGPAQSGILSVKEAYDVFLSFTAEQKPALPFSTTPRSNPDIMRCSLLADCVAKPIVPEQTNYGVTLSVDKSITLVGFGMFGSSKPFSGLFGYVQVVESGFPENGHDSSVIPCHLNCDGTNKIYYVYFDTEFTLEVNREYYIQLFKDYKQFDFGDIHYHVVPNRREIEIVSNGVTLSFEGHYDHNQIECHPAAEILFYLKDDE